MCMCVRNCVCLYLLNIDLFLTRHRWLRNISDEHLLQTIWAGREEDQNAMALLRNLKLATNFTQKAVA